MPFTRSLVLAVVVAAPLPAQDAAPKKYALLVGVNEYDHAELTKLGCAENDVVKLKGVLEKSGYEVVLLTGRQATKAAVEKGLTGLTRKHAKGDVLLVGLAGHGVQFGGDKDGYFCPVDARPFKDRADTLVAVPWVYERLHKDTAAGPKFLLVDACRNEPDPNRGRSGGVANPTAPPNGVGVLVSCSAGELAFEGPKFGDHGAFFQAVIKGLSGDAADRRGNVTWDSLRSYVKEEVVVAVPKALPGRKQTPEESGRLAGVSPVLAVKGAAAPPNPFAVGTTWDLEWSVGNETNPFWFKITKWDPVRKTFEARGVARPNGPAYSFSLVGQVGVKGQVTWTTTFDAGGQSKNSVVLADDGTMNGGGMDGNNLRYNIAGKVVPPKK